MRFALLALVGLLCLASDVSAFGRRVRVQQVVVGGHRAQQVVVQPQRVVVQQQQFHAQPQRVVVQQQCVGGQCFNQPQRVIVQQAQQHHAQPVILQQVVPAYQFFSR